MKHVTILIACLLVGLAACSGAQEESDDTENTENNANNTTNNDIVPQDYTGLVINELAAKGEPSDWFELYNGSGQAIDLTGVTVSDDPATPTAATIEPGTTISAGSYLVLEANDETLGFKLGGEESLGLYAPDGTQIDFVEWLEGDSPENKSYGRLPDGTGEFQTLDTPSQGTANVANGEAECGNGSLEGAELCDGTTLSEETCTSQGFDSGTLACNASCDGFDTSGCQMNTPMPADIVINEVISKDDDSIELFNKGAAAVDVSRWYVADDKYDPETFDPTSDDSRYDLPDGTSIEAGGYLVLIKDTDHTFGLGGQDTVTLYDANDVKVDEVTWPDGDADEDWCRFPNGTGDFQVCSMRTFGEENVE